MSYQCSHDMGWWSQGDGVAHCIGCNLAVDQANLVRAPAIKHDAGPRPKLRLIQGGKEERDVHDRDLPGGAA